MKTELGLVTQKQRIELGSLLKTFGENLRQVWPLSVDLCYDALGWTHGV